MGTLELKDLRPRIAPGSTGWILAGGMAALMMAFVVIWCSQTTFRAMSDWKLYAFNLGAAMLLSLPALLSRRIWVQILMMVLVAALLEANLMYCRTYLAAIPLESYGLASNLGDFTASVRDSLRWGDLSLLAIIVLTGICAYRIPKRSRKWGRPLPYCLAALLLLGLGCLGAWAKGGFLKEYGRLSQACYYSTCAPAIYTVGGTALYQSLSTPERLTQQVEAEITGWENEKEAVRPWRSIVPPCSARRNLVVILLESFESWPLEAKTAAGDEITPYLNSLLRDSTTLFFPNMLTQVASGRSIDCQLMLTCGLLPMENSVWSMTRPAADYPSLPKAMRQLRGAKSAILTCDKPITWNQQAVARSMGYDTLLHRADWRIDEEIGNPPKLSDGSFLRQAVAKLKTDALGLGRNPYMLTFVTYSGHNPFRLPEAMKNPGFTKGLEGLPERAADYIGMANYTDGALRVLVEYLKSRDDWNETLVVITGDHEGLAGDRKEILKSAEARKLVSPGQFTPFIVLNSPVGGLVESVIGQIDLYPTLLDMLGLGNYAWKGMGQNALDPDGVKAAVSSMTGEISGDTLRATPRQMRNLKNARKVSDKIIRLKL